MFKLISAVIFLAIGGSLAFTGYAFRGQFGQKDTSLGAVPDFISSIARVAQQYYQSSPLYEQQDVLQFEGSGLFLVLGAPGGAFLLIGAILLLLCLPKRKKPEGDAEAAPAGQSAEAPQPAEAPPPAEENPFASGPTPASISMPSVETKLADTPPPPPVAEPVDPFAAAPTAEPVDPFATAPTAEPVDPFATAPTAEPVDPFAAAPAAEPVAAAPVAPAVEPVAAAPAAAPPPPPPPPAAPKKSSPADAIAAATQQMIAAAAAKQAAARGAADPAVGVAPAAAPVAGVAPAAGVAPTTVVQQVVAAAPAAATAPAPAAGAPAAPVAAVHVRTADATAALQFTIPSELLDEEFNDAGMFYNIEKVVAMSQTTMNVKQFKMIVRVLRPEYIPFAATAFGSPQVRERVGRQVLFHHMLRLKREQAGISADQFSLQDKRMGEAERETICRRYVPTGESALTPEAVKVIGELFVLNEQQKVQQHTMSQAEDWKDVSLRNFVEIMNLPLPSID